MSQPGSRRKLENHLSSPILSFIALIVSMSETDAVSHSSWRASAIPAAAADKILSALQIMSTIISTREDPAYRRQQTWMPYIDVSGDGGVQKEVLEEGTGVTPQNGDTVFAHYTGMVIGPAPITYNLNFE